MWTQRTGLVVSAVNGSLYVARFSTDGDWQSNAAHSERTRFANLHLTYLRIWQIFPWLSFPKFWCKSVSLLPVLKLDTLNAWIRSQGEWVIWCSTTHPVSFEVAGTNGLLSEIPSTSTRQLSSVSSSSSYYSAAVVNNLRADWIILTLLGILEQEELKCQQNSRVRQF